VPDDVLDALATRIKQKVGKNFLLARTVARTLTHSHRVLGADELDSASEQWSSLRTAFDADLARYGADTSRVRDILLPLAYARGRGLPWEHLWACLATELSGVDYDDTDVHWVHHEAGAYIVEVRDGERSLFRLYHEEFAKYLRRGRDDVAADERTITSTLLATLQAGPQGRDWDAAHPYIRGHLASHAAAADASGERLADLVADAGFLCAAEPPSVLEALRGHGPEMRGLLEIYERFVEHRLSAAPEEWPAYLGLAAVQAGEEKLASAAATVPGRSGWRPRWAAWNRPLSHRVLDRGPGPVRRLQTLNFDGRPAAIVVYGSQKQDPGSTSVIDLETGACLAETGPWGASHVATLDHESGPLVCAGSATGEVLLWRPSSAAAATSMKGSQAGNDSYVAVSGAGAEVVVVVVVDDDVKGALTVTARELSGSLLWTCELPGSGPSEVRIASLEGRDVVLASHTSGGGADNPGLVALALGDGNILASWPTPVMVSDLTSLPGGDRFAVRIEGGVELMDLTSGVFAEVDSHGFGRCAVVHRGDEPLLACIDSQFLRLHDVLDGQQRGEVWLGRDIADLVESSVQGKPCLITGHEDGSLRRWDLDRLFERVNQPGPVDSVTASSLAEDDVRDVLAVGLADGRLQTRVASTGRLVAEASERFLLYRVWFVPLGGRRRLALSCPNGLFVLDSESLTIEEHHKGEGMKSVRALDVAEVDGVPVLATAGYASPRNVVCLWSANTMQPFCPPLEDVYEDRAIYAVRIASSNGRHTILAGGANRYVTSWDLADARAGKYVERDFWWSLANPQGVVNHQDYVRAIAVDPAAPSRFVSVGDDGTVRISDLHSSKTIGLPNPRHGWLYACCVVDGLALTGGTDGMLTAWRMNAKDDDKPVFTIQLDAQVVEIEACTGGVAVATSEGTIVIDLAPGDTSSAPE
jgi:WD40 repeat protein